jgi:AraC-like DNA-binding protein
VQRIALGRVAHLLAFTDFLREIGAPVQRELDRAGLPTLLAKKPDASFPLPPGLGFLRSIERAEGIDDLGFQASKNETFDVLGSDLRNALRTSVTLFSRMRRFGELVTRESSNCRVSILRERDDFRICNNLIGIPWLEGRRYSEWIQIIVLVEIVREELGAQWCPSEITFQSRFDTCRSAFEHFHDTRILFGQGMTSIKVPASVLSRPLVAAMPSQWPPPDTIESISPLPISAPLDLSESLKSALRTQLGEGTPDIRTAAELSGSSVRTIQRRLAALGRSYSSIVDEMRFEAALEMMCEPNIRLLDVAISVGYTDPSNFSRAFRRFAGVSPREYRRMASSGFLE